MFRRPILILVSLSLAAGCRTPAEHLADADKEVYALIDARRAEGFGLPEGFTLDPPADSLRQRILRGEHDESRPLSLVEVLEIAAENNRQVLSRKEQLYRVALDLTLERHLVGNRYGADAVAQLSGGDEIDLASVGGGLTFTRILGNGADLVLGLGSDLLRVVNTGDGWDAASSMSLRITQPLLRGSGRRIAFESLTQAERNLIYEVRAFERFRRTFAVDVAREVYDLLQAEDTLANEERNYDNLVELRERNEALAEAGRLSDIQVDQAKQDELRSEATLLRLRGSIGRQRDQFNLFLGLPIDTDLVLDPSEFSSLTDKDPVLDALHVEPSIDHALQSRLDHLTVLDGVDDQLRAVAIAEDNLRAALGLELFLGQDSEDGKPLSYRGTGRTMSASLAYDAPLDKKAERNAFRSSLITLVAIERDAEEAEDQIRAGVRDAFRQARNAGKDYLIQQGAVELSSRRVESANLNLDAGRADTRDVLDAQEALVGAENAATSALINFTLSRLELYLSLELLRVDDSGIYLDDDLIADLLEEE